MIVFNRAMMACDLSDMDKHMLRFFKTIKDAVNIKKLYFIHIMPDVTLPKNADLEFHKLFSSEYPVDEKIEDKIKLDIEEVLGSEHNVDYDIEVVEGQPYQKLIHWAEVKEVGLLVVGRKKKSQGSGITARRVARHAKSNILFVPEDASDSVKRILVPIDYSDNSARAMRTALNIQSRSEEEVEVIGIHIIDMPPADYYMRPIEHTGFIKMLEDSAVKAYKEFMKKHAFASAEVEPVFIENMYNNTAAHLNDYSMDENIDLVIMGAQGHSAFNSFLFGSVTEKLVDKIEKPVLIIR
jgi:nucleotide-binding universal stress UspA family protein